MGKIKAQGDFIVVIEKETEKVTGGGIILSSGAIEKPLSGTVVSVGPGAYNGMGVREPIGINEGDVVLFVKGHGEGLEIDGVHYLFIKGNSVVAIQTEGE
jgi:chaperonin GroES|tara:strand:+ start:2961 stop:3260 length:300 start_codon:yes stop_codon:yes gene_type:complete